MLTGLKAIENIKKMTSHLHNVCFQHGSSIVKHGCRSDTSVILGL
jgi:hypothetical protein